MADPAPDPESDSLADAAANSLADSESDDAADADKGPSLLKRLHAWWEGHDLSEESDSDLDSVARPGAKPEGSADATADEESSPVDLTAPDPAVVWSKDRIILSQAVWGDGLIWPGGIDYIGELVNGLPLNPKVSMLELGAGLGAASRAVVEKFGT